VINQKKEFVVQKRSKQKDYCPGWLDLTSGGVIGADENEDESAARELEEELSINEPDPQFLYKFKFEDNGSKAWCYTYYYIYNGKVKAQESEIDALFFWTEEQILQKISQGSLITPDSLVAFNKFLPHWHKIQQIRR
jgi:8-oxo-dGTP pyrophosphatase MutT (NUDIX family)